MPARPALAPTTDADPLVRQLPADLGRLSWQVDGGHWTWSDSVYALHGYPPGAAVPSTALALQHKHPDDLYDCVDALHAGMVTGRLIVHEHRLIAVDGSVRPVILLARAQPSGAERAQSVHGFLLGAEPGCLHCTPRPAGLTRVLVDYFQITTAAAEVMLACRLRRTARRAPSERTAHLSEAPGFDTDPRRLLEDALFPLRHLLPQAPVLAA